MKSQQSGFTLVELIVVIVILGILAATALPRFINVTGDARVAAVNGFAGGVRSAVAVTQAGWAASGGTSTGVTMLDGTNVAVSATTGIPTGPGLGAALRCNGTNCGGFTANAGFTTFTLDANNACSVGYTPASGDVTVTTC
jgi:MSHA pilin protein MshA